MHDCGELAFLLPGGIVAVPADQVKNGKAAFVADDGLAVDQARAHR
jgi:hypothetical protein